VRPGRPFATSPLAQPTCRVSRPSTTRYARRSATTRTGPTRSPSLASVRRSGVGTGRAVLTAGSRKSVRADAAVGREIPGQRKRSRLARRRSCSWGAAARSLVKSVVRRSSSAIGRVGLRRSASATGSAGHGAGATGSREREKNARARSAPRRTMVSDPPDGRRVRAGTDRRGGNGFMSVMGVRMDSSSNPIMRTFLHARCYGRWGNAAFTSVGLRPRDVPEPARVLTLLLRAGEGHLAGRSVAPRGAAGRPVVPFGRRRVRDRRPRTVRLGRYSPSSGAPCTSRGRR
jgi:hypothetical protein